MTTAIEVQQPQALTPMGMIEMAVKQGASVDVLRDLFKLKQEVEADEARKAFSESFSAFKAESVRVVKNVTVSEGPLKGKKYADLFAVTDTLTPILSKHGLSSSWKLTKDDPTWIEVTCTIRHIQGHQESVSMGAAPDTGPGRNAIQARMSAVSYLERYTLLAATGMAAAGEDTDGNAPVIAGLTEKQEAELQDYADALRHAPDLPQLKNVFADAYKFAGSISAQEKSKMSRVYEECKRRLQ